MLEQSSGPPPAPAQTANEPEDQGMTLIEHLVELRKRLMRASLAIFIGMGFGLFLVLGPFKLVDFIIESFTRADRGYPPIQAVGTTETFTSYMTVALAVGVILAMPAIVYQLLAFIMPGLTRIEQRAILIALPFVTAFFVAGLAFGWFITVPTAIRFLIDFSDSPNIQTQPALADFIRVVTTLLLINGIVFELPVIIYVMALLGIVTADDLARYRRYAAVIVVIVAAIITPTGDPINLALLAIPMYLLYELGVVLARLTPNRRRGDTSMPT